MFRDFLFEDVIYNPSDIDNILSEIKYYCVQVKKPNTKISYINIPCAFDIETSSFYYHGEKCAVMYMWSFGIYGKVVIGRTWEQFLDIIKKVSETLCLDENIRLICFIHNLSYEFQFFRKYFNWTKIFAARKREPIYALTDLGIEFRCSYILSGYSLFNIGKNLIKYKIEKLTGYLDYTQIRHTKTPLSLKECKYSANDVRVVMAYIMERIEIDGNIIKIPLTKTGYVRIHTRNNCFYENGIRGKKNYKYVRYMDLIKSMRLTYDEYLQLKRAFAGGFTHANPFTPGKVFKCVTSFDFTSSYPAVMVAEKFPMSSSEVVQIESKEQFEKYLKCYCCLFDIEIWDLEPILWYENYISESRCRELQSPVVDNGRIISAKHLKLTITEQDYLVIRKFYKWDKARVYNFRIYRKGYLPTDFIKTILKLYADKTTLKGVQGKEAEYLSKKEMINSLYGMTVTDIIQPIITYTNETIEGWSENSCDFEKEIFKYNNSSNRFLFYPWGVWVTAYARRNLFTGIMEFSDDYIYSDTDSIKVQNAEKHMNYINKYNDIITKQIETALNFHNIPLDSAKPKTVDGIEKPLGVWDFDGHYSRFKTLGAKRYLIEYSNDIRNKKIYRGRILVTVAGLNKVKGSEYLSNGWYYDIKTKTEYNSPFERFNENAIFPKDDSGRLIHTYIDNTRSGVITDYLGNVAEFKEETSVHLEQSEYSMKISNKYFEFIRGFVDIDISD